jgi:hypothetical protein
MRDSTAFGSELPAIAHRVWSLVQGFFKYRQRKIHGAPAAVCFTGLMWLSSKRSVKVYANARTSGENVYHLESDRDGFGRAFGRLQCHLDVLASRQYHAHAAVTADLGFAEQSQLRIRCLQHLFQIAETWLV